MSSRCLFILIISFIGRLHKSFPKTNIGIQVDVQNQYAYLNDHAKRYRANIPGACGVRILYLDEN